MLFCRKHSKYSNVYLYATKNLVIIKLMKLKVLFFRRKSMTNLDSILKSRDITLPIKVSLVKVMIFPVIMYGFESWTIKKAEHQRIDAS